MLSPILIFNPEHDLCLANGSPFFVPPSSALEMGRKGKKWLQCLCPDATCLCTLDLASNLEILSQGSLIPWGWDAVIRENLLKAGLFADKLPSANYIELVRQASHRRTAAEALEYLRERQKWIFPCKVLELSEVGEVYKTIAKLGETVLKAPWSGSGRGLRWIHRDLLETDRGWIGNVLEKQGSIMAEPRYKVLQDFAMLFSCKCGEDGEKITFEGYSMFETLNGVYRNNILGSNDYLEECLSSYISKDIIHSVRDCMTDFLQEKFSSWYTGCIGVDMFIYESFGQTMLHPCVEINVRMTMGLIARKIFDQGSGAIHNGELLYNILNS